MAQKLGFIKIAFRVKLYLVQFMDRNQVSNMPLKIFKGLTTADVAKSRSEAGLAKGPSELTKIKYIIAVAAGKGGVGKSAVTVNLALALRQKGLAVGILDADVYGPSVRKMLPEDRFPSQRDSMITPALCAGIKVISIAYFRKDTEAAAIRAPIANSLIQQFIRNVEWGELDFLLIDCPPGTGDVQLTLSQNAQLSSALIITTPQEIALLDVRKAIQLFEMTKIPILGIVENMSYYWHEKSGEKLYLFGQGGGEKLALEKGVPFLGAVPIDPLIGTCADKGQALVFRNEPEAERAKSAFSELADRLLIHSKTLAKEQETALSHFQLLWRDM